MQHRQATVIEKLISTQERERNQGKSKNKSVANTDANGQLQTLINKHKTHVRLVIGDQTTEWTNLVMRQITEQHTMVRDHVTQRTEVFQQTIAGLQRQQVKDFEACQARENKELRARQVKQSVDSTKSVNADKKIKNKAERDRRIRELNENNTKKFIEERKRLAIVQSRQLESLNKVHEDQRSKLEREMLKEIEVVDNCYEEAKLAHRPQTIV